MRALAKNLIEQDFAILFTVATPSKKKSKISTVKLSRLTTRPGLMESKFSTTHFPGPIGALINMLEGFCSQMTL